MMSSETLLVPWCRRVSEWCAAIEMDSRILKASIRACLHGEDGVLPQTFYSRSSSPSPASVSAPTQVPGRRPRHLDPPPRAPGGGRFRAGRARERGRAPGPRGAAAARIQALNVQRFRSMPPGPANFPHYHDGTTARFKRVSGYRSFCDGFSGVGNYAALESDVNTVPA